MTTNDGSTATMTIPTTSGIRTTLSFSSCLATGFIFIKPRYLDGVCVIIFLIHPPSIFPISFSFSEMVMYFLLSSNFISHAISRKNLSRSKLFDVFDKTDNFSWPDK